MKKILLFVFSCLLLTSCDQQLKQDEFPDWHMVQHQYQIDIDGDVFNIWRYWNTFYASFIEEYPESFKGKKDPTLVFSHRRWYPKEYGTMFWNDYGLDYSEMPDDHNTWEGWPIEKDGQEVRVSFLGQDWHCTLGEGDIRLYNADGGHILLKRLPDKNYDGSLDDLLKKIR